MLVDIRTCNQRRCRGESVKFAALNLRVIGERTTEELSLKLKKEEEKQPERANKLTCQAERERSNND